MEWNNPLTTGTGVLSERTPCGLAKHSLFMSFLQTLLPSSCPVRRPAGATMSPNHNSVYSHPFAHCSCRNVVLESIRHLTSLLLRRWHALLLVSVQAISGTLQQCSLNGGSKIGTLQLPNSSCGLNTDLVHNEQ